VNQVAHFQGQFVFEPVIDALAILLAREDFRRRQEGEMPGNVRLRCPGGLHNFAYRALSSAQGLQDPQTHRLTQEPEMRSNLLQLTIRQLSAFFFF